MKYVILIYHNPGARQQFEALPADQRARGLAVYEALNEELRASGELIVSEPLADPSTGKKVSVRDGRVVTTDGPFAEAKEHLAGLYLIDCDSMDRAVGYAARIPEASFATVEVRPILGFQGTDM
ncbi:MAG: hypothetical protein QOJ11_902 [Frankiales bacterium]|nr:hypothetical protein [Frankiales bacterium]